MKTTFYNIPILKISFVLLFIIQYSVSFSQQDSSVSRKGTILLPVISRSIETDWAFGLAGSFTIRLSKDDTVSRTSNVQSLLLYSLRKQFVAAINGTIYFPNEKYILTGQLSLSSFPDKFWGVGNNAPDSNEEAYTFQQYYIYPHLQRKITSRLYLGVLYEFQDVFKVDYIKGGLLDQQDVPGKEGYKISGLGASITWDSRNHAFTPDRGSFFQFLFNHFGKYLGSDYDYTNYVIDARKFFRFYKRQVLALQAYGFFNAGTVPLRSLASFGGANSMRGYYDGRYRDKDQMVFQAEYRVPVWKRFGVVAFGNTGGIAAKLSEFSVSEFKYSYGAGLRYALSKRENLNLRLDYGIGQGNSHGFYIQLGEAF